jgi:uracil phosphoribosyltransferase
VTTTARTIVHPLVADKLLNLRNANTPTVDFRTTLDALAYMLLYEATRDAVTLESKVTTPLGLTARGAYADQCPLIVPVLRAGLGMLNAALRLLPHADVAMVGLARDEETLLPRTYLNALPNEIHHWHTYVLEPMLATGGSAANVCELLFERGAREITVVSVLASPQALQTLTQVHADLQIVVAAVDDGLNDKGYIVPGLGDAGDRLYGVPPCSPS